ncbi:MAG: hypothetical protein GXY17_05105 [Clostridiaceae bacterium]|nr:hypothetical protein [Clostridiaceae bacterium]
MTKLKKMSRADGKKYIKSLVFVLSVAILITLMPTVAQATEPTQAADAVIDVSTVAELRTALENDAGAHIRLTKNITFTRANAADEDGGVNLGEGYYIIDLNNYKIEYNYKGRNGDPNGSPLVTRNTKGLTINGPGNIIGGAYAVEQGNPRGFLKVNGGKLQGVINSGIRMTGGVAYINGGTVTGNFYGVFHEDGIVVLNGGTVKSVRYKNMGYQSRQYGVVKNGIFTGNATLEDLVLIVDDLTISAGSSIKTVRGGGLIVKNSFVNNGTFTHESGIKSIGGEALIINYLGVTIGQDVAFKSLQMQERAWLTIENGATVTVSDTFVTEQGCSIIAKDGTLRLLGSIDHSGYAEGVPELEALQGDNGGPGPGSEQRDFIMETTAAEKLKALGLFQGVGTNPDGSTNFDLARKPSRTEALVMLIRLLGKDNEATSGSWTHPFTDVPKWADNYVGYAYENKLTNGISATEFGTGTASYKTYLTFVLRALGYSDKGGVDFTWDMPDDLALSIGIMSEGMHHEDFLRADVVLVSEAALNAMLKDGSNSLLDKLIEDGAVTQTP